jgi:hypothetical protein
MKPIACLALAMMSLAACHDRDSDHNMPTLTDPASDSNSTSNAPDTSTRKVQDSSTSIGYDTSSQKK